MTGAIGSITGWFLEARMVWQKDELCLTGDPQEFQFVL